MGEDFRLRQGCDGGTTPVARLPDGSHLFECPGRIVTRQTAAICGLYPSWEAGRSIGAATVLGESAALVAALRTIGSEINAFQREEMKRG